MAESAFYKQVFENNRKWIAEKKAIDKDYFTRLAQGQKPEILYIGCSDSRATAEELMGAGPGEVFVHRNIANIVGSSDLNALSVVNFAIGTLHVKHVVVCGHYGCGGVKAAMVAKDMGLLNPWLRHVRDVYRLHREELGRRGAMHQCDQDRCAPKILPPEQNAHGAWLGLRYAYGGTDGPALRLSRQARGGPPDLRPGFGAVIS